MTFSGTAVAPVTKLFVQTVAVREWARRCLLPDGMRRVRKGAGLNARQRKGLESDVYDGEDADGVDYRDKFLEEVPADDDDAIVGTDEEIDSDDMPHLTDSDSADDNFAFVSEADY